MKKLYSSALCLIGLAPLFNASAQCPSGRYTTAQFGVDTAKNIQYGSNISTQDGTTTIDLFMDIYTPKNDTMSKRPVVVMAHGGSFIGGTKTDGDITYMCTELASRGYVCASISYRLQTAAALAVPATAKEKMVKEVIAAAQDGKAAVRFFRKDAATSNSYKVDADQIFFGGTSAGAVLGIHMAYLDSTDAMDSSWRAWAVQMGGFEGNSGNPGYPATVKAIVSYAGAIGDVNWIHGDDVPFADWHSQNDATVPDSTGYPLGLPYLPTLTGGRLMHRRADAVGTYNFYHQYPGSSHPPFISGTSIDPTIIAEMRDETVTFLYSRVLCNPAYISGIEEINAAAIQLSPNPATSQITISADKAIRSIDVIDQLGRTIKTVDVQLNNSTVISVRDLTAGTYFAKVNGVANTIVKRFIIN
ncbi:MAG: T9SS type A sorting domain-containing protein [Chitinophagales bacterium]